MYKSYSIRWTINKQRRVFEDLYLEYNFSVELKSRLGSMFGKKTNGCSWSNTNDGMLFKISGCAGALGKETTCNNTKYELYLSN